MTTREICERLLILYADVNSLQTQIGVWNDPLDNVERDIRTAILDLAAPEEEKEKRKPHGVIIDQCGKETPRCLNCNGEAKIVHNGFGTGDDWAYCSKCGFSCRLKRGEGEK